MSSSNPGSEPVIRFDYHSHHYRCGHAAGNMEDYIQAAIGKGMTAFGVSDHGPAYFLPGDHALPGTQMAVSELPHYVAEAHGLKERFAGAINVRVGVEADFIPDKTDDLARLLDAHLFDYVLGSVHYVNGASVFNRRRWQHEKAPQTYAAYYALVIEAARSGLFDILSHLTVIEAYGPPVSPRLADELYPPVAEAVAASGCAVEVNTSGYRKMGDDRDPFPNAPMLRELVSRGVPLTFGSDCHAPAEVGYGRNRVAALLAKLGVDAAAAPRPVAVRRGPVLCFPAPAAAALT